MSSQGSADRTTEHYPWTWLGAPPALPGLPPLPHPRGSGLGSGPRRSLAPPLAGESPACCTSGQRDPLGLASSTGETTLAAPERLRNGPGLGAGGAIIIDSWSPLLQLNKNVNVLPPGGGGTAKDGQKRRCGAFSRVGSNLPGSAEGAWGSPALTAAVTLLRYLAGGLQSRTQPADARFLHVLADALRHRPSPTPNC